VLEKLDAQQKLTANQWKIAFAATIGDMLDFFDFGLIGFVLAFIVKDWHLTFGESGLILLASGISAPFGSLLWGWAADRIGRRKAMIGTVLNTSIATGAMALTPEHAWIYLVICRVFVGFGVTGMYSVDITIIQEFVPNRQTGLAHWSDNDDAAGRFSARRVNVGFRHSVHRLARVVCGRPVAGAPDLVYPRLGSRITVLADPHGAFRRGAPVTRLGIANGPERDRTAGGSARRRANALD